MTRKPVGSRRATPVPAEVSAQLQRSNRALRMLSDSNQALIRALDESSLLDEVCRIAVEVGGYRMAWVGFADPATGALLRPVAHAGFEARYLAPENPAWPETADPEGPAATALRSGEPSIVRDIPTAPGFATRREAALERGCLSAIAMPLRDRDRTYGILKVYSSCTDAFDADEVTILSELAGDLAYGIGVLRLRADRDRAAAALEETDRQLRTLIGNVPDFISRFDTAGRFIYVSPAVARATGFEAAQVLGHAPWELQVCESEADNTRLKGSMERVLAGEGSDRVEVYFRMPGGARPYEVRHIPELDDRGRVAGILGIATDLTERKRAERQTYLLRYALDQIGEGIWLMEGDSPRFSYVNRSAADSLGYTQEELTRGMGVDDIDPDWDARRWEAFVPLIRQQRRMLIETRHKTRDGRILPVEVTGNWFEHEGREYDLAISRDVSERKEAEARLRAREAEYRSLVENTPDQLVRWDRELHRVFVNPAFAAALGRPPDEVLRGSFGEGHPERAAAALAKVRDAIHRVLASGQGELLEAPLFLRGMVRMIQIRLVPERDESGQIVTVLGIGRDITALKDQERQLLSLTEHSPDLILRFDRLGRYVYANQLLEQLTGHPVADHLGRELGSVSGEAAPEVYAELRRRIGQVFEQREMLETTVRLPLTDGMHDFNVRLVPECDDAGNPVTVLAVVRDVTQQVQAEAALRASEQRFRQVTENIGEVFWLTDVDKREMVYVSPAYERVFGQPRETLARDPMAWLTMVHPEDQARVREAVAHQVSGGFDLEYRVQAPAGIRWIHDRAFPIADEQGRVYRIAGVAEDVTVRRELEERLRQSQKMDAVGQLAGGIAHDFNNMLAVVMMQCSLLRDIAPAGDLQEGLQEIEAASERAMNLTRQLLTFSRRAVTQPVDLDISEAIGRMTRLLQRVLGEDIFLVTRFAPALPPIHADPGMMEQVLMNLAINARDAMPGGGRLTISLEGAMVEAARARLHPGVVPGRYVCLTVADSGAGIPAELLPRIFEPFFTTKEVGKGTGLGLATVFGIVEQHHGWIEVESALGEGTTFRVFLPAMGRVRPTPRSEAAATAQAGGTETILLVEDEPALRSTSRAVLRQQGYRVLEAATGAEALECWAREGPDVDLLLTDLVMPGGMSGFELAEQLCAERPGLRVLYTTGYSERSGQPLHADAPGRRLLRKPYDAFELASMVRRVLDEAVGR